MEYWYRIHVGEIHEYWRQFKLDVRTSKKTFFLVNTKFKWIRIYSNLIYIFERPTLIKL